MNLIPVEYYSPLYFQVSLVLTLFLLYFTKANTGRELVSIPITQMGSVFLCLGMILFIGLRPMSAYYFVDMLSYGHMFDRVKDTPYQLTENVEWLYSWINWILAQYIEKETFFSSVCSRICWCFMVGL